MKFMCKSGQIPVHQRNSPLQVGDSKKILGMREVFLINYHRNPMWRIVIILFGQSKCLKHMEFEELPSIFQGVADLGAEPKSPAPAFPDWWWWWLNYWLLLLLIRVKMAVAAGVVAAAYLVLGSKYLTCTSLNPHNKRYVVVLPAIL